MLEKYYRINELTGIGLEIRPDGAISIQACSIRADGNKLQISKKLTDLPELSALKKEVPGKTVIALNISGRGVLIRQIEKTEAINQQNFSKILPNANVDDFHIQHFISGTSSFVAAIRRAEADKWIDQVNQQGFKVLSLSLGPFPVQQVIPQLNIYEGDLQFNGHLIERDEAGNWTSYRYDEKALSPFALKIDSEGIHEKLLVPYPAAFQLLMSARLDPVQANVPALDLLLHQQLEYIKLKANGGIALAVLFLLLLVNFLLFSGLNTANAKLSASVNKTAQGMTDVQQVNEQIQQREQLLKTLGWEGSISKSQMVDQLASLLPAEISWKELSVDPVDLSSSRIQKQLIFFERRIRITGTSEKIIPVNEWIARIKTKPWVKNVQMESYAFNSELNTGQFTLFIEY